jgi:hypothetical protein
MTALFDSLHHFFLLINTMSFLEHDMSQRDTANFFGPRAKGEARKPEELRAPRVRPSNEERCTFDLVTPLSHYY